MLIQFVSAKCQRNGASQRKNESNFIGFSHVSGFIGILVFFTNIFLWYVVRAYYESLKMMKRLTEEVVVPIPCPVVSVRHCILSSRLNSNAFSSFTWYRFRSISAKRTCILATAATSTSYPTHRPRITSSDSPPLRSRSTHTNY